MTDLEYRLIKEVVKSELLKEINRGNESKTESLFSEVRRAQQAIFDEYFPGLKQQDSGRYWRIKEAIIKLTNILRYREGKVSAWDSAIKTEIEAESAIATYKTICKVSAEMLVKID